jgi:hypothetical protein
VTRSATSSTNAAAEAPALGDDARSWYHTRTVPLTTDGSSGTDMRDVWASAFLHESRESCRLCSRPRLLGIWAQQSSQLSGTSTVPRGESAQMLS